MKLICKKFNELSTLELYRILYCRSEVFIMEQAVNYQDLDFKDQKSTHVMLTDNGEIVSYLRIIPQGVKYPESSIGRVITMKRYRNKGYARQLINMAIDVLKDSAQMPIRIEAQAYLKNFYESFGFKAVSQEYILEGLPHIDMIMTE